MSRREHCRVLLVAHHASPELTSEPLIGWRWASHLDSRVDLQLVTHVRNRAAIERSGGLRRPVRYVDTERQAARINAWNERLWSPQAIVNRQLLESLALRAFDAEAVRIGQELAAGGLVDVVHRVSPISPRAATRLGTFGVPLVLGPLNGGMRTASGFGEVERRERSWALRLRALQRLADPWGASFRNAEAVLVANETTRAVLPGHARAAARILCENAVEIERFTACFRRSGGSLRVLYVGRLLPYKGVEYLLRAVAGMKDASVHVDVVGDGPDRPRLENLRQQLSLGERVRFHGSVASGRVAHWMQRCDVFCLPSVRESGGSVVLEAMAAGKPVIVARHGGPAETVNDEVGFRVAASGPGMLVRGVQGALTKLARCDELRERMGSAARRRVEAKYTWAGKANFAVSLYSELLGRAARGVAA